jgi:hypothetical protein
MRSHIRQGTQFFEASHQIRQASVLVSASIHRKPYSLSSMSQNGAVTRTDFGRAKIGKPSSDSGCGRLATYGWLPLGRRGAWGGMLGGAPEPELRARNHHCHLIEMPPRRWPRASTAKFSGEQWPELQDPSPHRLVGDIQTALREQIFDVAIAERETHIKPNGVPHDQRGELVAGKRDRHAPSYPPNGCALSFA